MRKEQGNKTGYLPHCFHNKFYINVDKYIICSMGRIISKRSLNKYLYHINISCFVSKKDCWGNQKEMGYKKLFFKYNFENQPLVKNLSICL
jgi:hypothetical protein